MDSKKQIFTILILKYVNCDENYYAIVFRYIKMQKT